VQATGRAVTWAEHPWLEAPVGDVDVIGIDFFRRFAARRGLQVVEEGPPRGLVESFAALAGPACRPEEMDPKVADFYEHTSEYELDVWSEWSGLFRPFGSLLAAIFSRRLQQLNLPLSPLDTKLGIVSRVWKLTDATGRAELSAWVRETVATGRTLYAGSYSSCRVPGNPGPCVKVAFPLPNGFALVILKLESLVDGSFLLLSEGRRFGDPGFYFYVEAAPGRGWARYLSSFQERIHVFVDDRAVLRTDHTLKLWGAVFLRLHYRMDRRPPVAP
jgi:hypothetical protein